MAIAPIDIQTLYSQLENVSKSVAYQQQGIHLSNAIQQDKIARQQAEKNTSVQQVKKDNEDNISVKDRKSFQNEQNPSDKKNSKNESEEEDNPQTYRFKDPNLGKYIDISG
ncbi:MAG: hypothetical protein IKZ04_01385 [Spirochaetaceae bacterium]|nr:hypothetical protein [Spirochaetaceae bacterium]